MKCECGNDMTAKVSFSPGNTPGEVPQFNLYCYECCLILTVPTNDPNKLRYDLSIQKFREFIEETGRLVDEECAPLDRWEFYKRVGWLKKYSV